jgi:hypothetical protein
MNTREKYNKTLNKIKHINKRLKIYQVKIQI